MSKNRQKNDISFEISKIQSKLDKNNSISLSQKEYMMNNLFEFLKGIYYKKTFQTSFFLIRYVDMYRIAFLYTF